MYLQWFLKDINDFSALLFLDTTSFRMFMSVPK